jgi:hypothetical protein
MYAGEWRRPVQQIDVDTATKVAKAEFIEVDNREAKIVAMETKINKLVLAQNKKKFTISRNNIIKKKAVAPAVNRYGMPSPKKIRTEVSNAGKKSGKKSKFSKLAKKISSKSRA